MIWEIYTKVVEVLVILVTVHYIASYLETWILQKKKHQATVDQKSSAAAALKPENCSDLEVVKQMLVSSTWLKRFQNDHYGRSGTFNKPLGILMGDDLYWREARGAVMTAFRETNLLNPAHVQSLYVPEINIVLEKLRRKCSNDGGNYFTCSPNHLFAYPIIHVAFQFIFGRRLFENDPKEGTLVDQINYNRSNYSVCSSNLNLCPFLKYFRWLRPSFRAYMKLCRTIYNITSLERERRIQVPSSSSCPPDVMDSLIMTLNKHTGRKPNYFTFENLQVTIRDLLLGSDATNVALEHMILFMAAYQDEQQMVYDEIDHFIVENDRWPTYEDRERMIYTQAMLLETLRLGVPTISRVNNNDLWEDPLVFRPERFINDEKYCIRNAEKILPFSNGRRACPGELIGRIGLFMFTVALLREFKWELSDEHPQPCMKGLKGLTRAPASYYVKISPRALQNE